MNTVNISGLVEITAFLMQNHKTFADRAPTRSELSAWATAAEFQMDEGNPPAIEVSSHDSVTGRAVELIIDPAGVF